MKIKRSNFFLIIKRSLLCFLAAGLFFAQSLPAFAEDEIEARLAAQRAMEVQSNTVENWPTGPTVSAESAILIEAGTGAVFLRQKYTRERVSRQHHQNSHYADCGRGMQLG